MNDATKRPADDDGDDGRRRRRIGCREEKRRKGRKRRKERFSPESFLRFSPGNKKDDFAWLARPLARCRCRDNLLPAGSSQAGTGRNGKEEEEEKEEAEEGRKDEIAKELRKSEKEEATGIYCSPPFPSGKKVETNGPFRRRTN